MHLSLLVALISTMVLKDGHYFVLHNIIKHREIVHSVQLLVDAGAR